MMRACRICGSAPDLDCVPSMLRDLRRLLGPTWRATLDGLRDWMCWRCQRWLAHIAGFIRPDEHFTAAQEPQRRAMRG